VERKIEFNTDLITSHQERGRERRKVGESGKRGERGEGGEI